MPQGAPVLSTVSLPQCGGCVCGAARYELRGRPLLVYACHCHDCQSRSGAAFTLNMVVRTEHLSSSGSVDMRQRTVKRGRRILQACCADCGIVMWARATSAPDYTTLLAGTLDDAGWVTPIAQTFIESAIPWAVIPGVRSVPWSEFDYVELGRQWVAAAPAFTQSQGR